MRRNTALPFMAPIGTTLHCMERNGAAQSSPCTPWIPHAAACRASPREFHWRQASITGPAAPAPRADKQ